MASFTKVPCYQLSVTWLNIGYFYFSYNTITMFLSNSDTQCPLYGASYGSSLLSIARYLIEYELFSSFCNLISIFLHQFRTYNVFRSYGVSYTVSLPAASYLIEWSMSTEVPCHWLPGLDWIQVSFTLSQRWFRYSSIVTGFLVETNFIPSPRGYPRSFNRYYINRHHTMYSYACKKFDPAGAFPFANAPAGPYRWNISALAFLCIRSHERQIIYMRLGYTFIFTCRKAICQRYSIFFFLSEAS